MRSKEENPHKLVGQTKIVIVIEAEVAFKEEVVDEVNEMLSHIQQICEDHGIWRFLIAPYSPQENGVAERKNRTIC